MFSNLHVHLMILWLTMIPTLCKLFTERIEILFNSWLECKTHVRTNPGECFMQRNMNKLRTPQARTICSNFKLSSFRSHVTNFAQPFGLSLPLYYAATRCTSNKKEKRNQWIFHGEFKKKEKKGNKRNTERNRVPISFAE